MSNLLILSTTKEKMGTAMNDLLRGERLQIMLTKEELNALDNWRFSKRMPSRASAIRELLKRGLAAEGFDLVEGGSKSEDFGVTGKSSSSPTRDRRDTGRNGEGSESPSE
jgi:hypothetical protein